MFLQPHGVPVKRRARGGPSSILASTLWCWPVMACWGLGVNVGQWGKWWCVALAKTPRCLRPWLIMGLD